MTTAPEITHSSIWKELESIANWYRFGNPVDRVLSGLEPHLENYLEFTFQPDQYEIITGGEGDWCFDDFYRMANRLGIHSETLDWFTSAYRCFPQSILGLKVPVLRDHIGSPSLYVRSKCAKHKVFAWLLDAGLGHRALETLADVMKDNECFYGLGLSEEQGQPLLKTYTIDRIGRDQLGFVSHRIQNQRVLSARKEYTPEVPLPEFQPPSAEWGKLLEFLVNDMQYRTAGHLGYVIDSKGVSDPKIYVERVGSIPTDFEAK